MKLETYEQSMKRHTRNSWLLIALAMVMPLVPLAMIYLIDLFK